MTTDIQLAIAGEILKTGLVNRVYHSCEMLQDAKGRMYPAYPVGEEYMYASMDDTKKLFAYIRINGDGTSTPLKVDSCTRAYDIRFPLRVVFFNDHEERDKEFLITKLSSFVFMDGVTLQRIITDKFKLAKEESDRFSANMDGHVFYVAVDVLVKNIHLFSTCENAACIVHQNPLCI